MPVSGAAIVGLCSYTVFACLCNNKSEGNEIHPYVAFVPIIRYVIIKKSILPIYINPMVFLSISLLQAINFHNKKC